jgi:hypothetical protein
MTFDFAPATLALPRGQQRSILVRVTGEATLTNTSIVVAFDPKVVAAIAVRPILSDIGVADAHIESGRVVIDIPSAVTLSGTRAVAEITLQGIAPGRASLTFEKPTADAAVRTDAVVQVE